MATLGHAAIGLALGRAFDPSAPRLRRLAAMAGFAALAMLPDLDALGGPLGLPQTGSWVHRGAAHSMVMALALGAVVGAVTRRMRRPSGRVWLFATLALLSHGLIDTLTDEGSGVAVFWPFVSTRYFAPWRPIQVAPLDERFASLHGLHCLLLEVVVFSPFWIYAIWPRSREAQGRVAASRR